MIIYGDYKNTPNHLLFYCKVPKGGLDIHPDIEKINLVVTNLSNFEYEVIDGFLTLDSSLPVSISNDSTSTDDSPTPSVDLNIVSNVRW